MSSEFERLMSFSDASIAVVVHMVTDREEEKERIWIFHLFAAKQRETDARALKEAEEVSLKAEEEAKAAEEA